MARAIENQCFSIGVNRIGLDGNNSNHVGDSMVVGPLGDLIHQSYDQEGTFHVLLQKETIFNARASFPFWKDADRFTIL